MDHLWISHINWSDSETRTEVWIQCILLKICIALKELVHSHYATNKEVLSVGLAKHDKILFVDVTSM